MNTADELIENLRAAKAVFAEAKRNCERLEAEIKQAHERQTKAAAELQAARSAIDHAAEPTEAG